MRKIFSKIQEIPVLFGVAAVAFFIVGCYAYTIVFPCYMGAGGYDSDPSYVYLLNGLSLLYGIVPGHVDHPGTPLQVFCAIVIFLQWGLCRIVGVLGGGDILTSVITNPESYIATVSMLLLVMNTFALILLALRVFRLVGKRWAGIAILLMPFLFPILIPRSFYLSPEALLIFSANCLLVVLLPCIFQKKEIVTSGIGYAPILSGILFGFGLAVKLTFLPMLVLLFLHRGTRRVLTSVLFACGSFMVFISPVLSRFGYIIHWAKAIAEHTGSYGQGTAGIVDWAVVPERAIKLFVEFPLAFFVAVLLLVAPIILKRLNLDGRRLVPWVLSAVFFFQFVLILKHYGLHYMIPALPVSLVGAVWFVWVTKFYWDKSILWGSILSVLVGVGLVVAVNTTANMMEALASSRAQINKENKEIDNVLDMYPDALIIGSYRCGLQQAGIFFGLDYTDGKLQQLVLPLFENYTDVKYVVYLQNPNYSAEKINELIHNGKSVLFLSINNAPWLEPFSKKPILALSTRTLYEINKVL